MCQNKRPGRRGKLARQHRSGDFTHFSLFTGIGGIDLAAEWAGFTTVGQCELADYPTKVLEKHWPGVPRWRDIRGVTAESVRAAGITNITVLSGGFPCQPFSVAGKQKGKKDDRYLWPEMLRVIRELAPRWVVAENVPGILRIAGKTVCEDLEREGYVVTIFNFEAAAVGAPHRRDRVFFVAHSRCPLRQGGIIKGTDANEDREGTANITERPNCPSKANVADTKSEQGRRVCQPRLFSNARASCEDVPNTYSPRCEEFHATSKPKRKRYDSGDVVKGRVQWAAEPNVGRVANGIPSRVDRLKCLGNAVVPQQVYPILQAIAEIESG